MKKLNFLMVILLISVFVNAQENKVAESEIFFKFKDKTDISKNFVDRVNDKYLDFEIIGIDSKQTENNLIQSISNYRGVKDFSIEVVDNKYIGHLHLYEYADHWMYYKFLFIKNGINNVMFGDQKIKSEKLSEL